MENVSTKVYQNDGNLTVISHVKKEGARILDIGCGVGDNARLLVAKGHVIDGITLSPQERDLALEHCRNVYIHNLELGLPMEVLSEKYDYIICSHILEHIAFPTNLLLDMHKIAIANLAEVIVALPNLMYYKTRIKILFGNFDYTDSGIMDYTHLRWYTMKSSTALFESFNFNIKVSFVEGLAPFNRIFSLMSKKAPNFVKKFLFSMAPTLFGSELILVLNCKVIE
ncbi:class I SAM-dependent methyltransferase [Pedobacter sp. G11]|uniref:class I SAM-dependent methyltransferase n=1 Tax=Pedobacter sp. G11 TaxID=2482728 RepID=UPI000F5F3715|nr:class I SAM-dependent methyltransferase [Pedobacter sp. G11]AZI25832.1 class I SAM-dependent methyltransferase [Pedobacter sp. G11]